MKNRLFSIFDSQLTRFLFVGGINTLFGYSVYAFLIFINVHFTVAAFISTVLGIVFNFKTTGRLVFKNKDNSLIVKFAAVYGITYLANIVCLYFFHSLSIDLYIAGAVLIVPMGLLSFILNKVLVFRR